MTSTAYRGRFAPSPSGRLHFGSLVTALASYLDARAHQGTWLVRMEDLDPPREEPGAADAILRSLAAHGLHSDEPILYQSQRLDYYDAIIDELLACGLAYFCQCNRKRLSQLNGIYDGHCRRHPSRTTPAAVRIKLVDTAPWQISDTYSYVDRVQGPQSAHLPSSAGDPVIKRRDGLHGYTLAVIVDDISQRISHIVRGADLLEVTPGHLAIYDLLQHTQILPNQPPSYAHTPLVIDADGYKLSKQNRAPAIDDRAAPDNIARALAFLGMPLPQDLRGAPAAELLAWAVGAFDMRALQRVKATQTLAR